MCPSEELSDGGDKRCACCNCVSIFEQIVECSICVEPYYESGVCSCQTCGNLMCCRCVERLLTCPFCRVSFVFPSANVCQRNIAIERLFKTLKLPCRYFRRGCCQQLRENDRESHERVCQYCPTKCPLDGVCCWQGDINELSGHLKEKHSLILLTAHKVTVEISSLHRKVKETEDHLSKYVIVLQCHSSFFFCKIVLHKRMLKIVFLEVTKNGSDTNQKFAALLQFDNSVKTMKGVLEIPNNVRYNKELDISCDQLLPSWNERSENDLKILIRIQPVDG